MPVKIFCCYSHADEVLLNQLKSHLKPLQRENLIDVWHDRDISAGTEWEVEIKKQLESAEIILLLVSPDFMNSDYCYSKELQQALERYKAGEAKVISIILRPVYWQGTLGQLQVLPKDAVPVTDPLWHNVDRAFLNVVEGIRVVLNDIHIKETLNKADELYNDDECDDAITLYEQVIKLNPNYVEAYIGKGLSLEYLDRFEEALSAFEQAILLKPENAYAYELKGSILTDLGYYDQALLAYERAIQFDADNDLLYIFKGKTLQELNRAQEAIEAYDKAIQLNSLSILAYIGKGEVLNKIGQYSDALKILRQLLVELFGDKRNIPTEDELLHLALADLFPNINRSSDFTDVMHEASKGLKRQKIKHPPQGTTTYTYTTKYSVRSLRWSPDGKAIALIDGITLQVLDMAIERKKEKTYALHPLTLPRDMSDSTSIEDIAWAPNSQYIAIASYRGVLVWNFATRTLVTHYKGHNNFLTSDNTVHYVSWLPGGDCIASLKLDSNNIHIWQAFTGEKIRNIGFRGEKYSRFRPAWSPDGKYVAVISKGGRVEVLGAITGRNIFTLEEIYYTNIIGWSVDSRHFSAFGIKEINVWNATIRKVTTIYNSHFDFIHVGVWSPNGTYIASGGKDNIVQVWEATTGRTLFTYKGHKSAIIYLAWSPDGTLIASGDENGTIYVWQVF